MEVCLVQTRLAWEAPANNREHLEQFLSAAGNADLYVLPEMFSTGFSMNAEPLAEVMSGDTVAWMKRMAKELDGAVCGSLIIEDQGRYYNRFVLAKPNGDISTYDKRHLFRMSAENDHYSAGTGRLTMSVGEFTLFPQVCYDLRFPVYSRNDLGFHLMVYVANWPAARREHWRTLLAARAIENQCYVIGVNRVGIDGNDVAYCGDSMAVGFDGSLLLDLGDGEATALVTLDLPALDEWRSRFPAWMDADGFDLRDP